MAPLKGRPTVVVGRMAQYTSDQVMVQRLQTTRSLRDARSAFVVNAIALDGETTWFEGVMLVAVYILLALAFFFATAS